ncbi:NADH dehydrogenase [ubiquinone] 1 subunit C2 [Onthophagus taurus]|uniref:NADH dehydrogenase [ubiquinone] 1 subunit C2 n=1 Tax=Onthophagus taurus TaxID=166361 RepID=UPI0039BE7340
MATGPKVVLDPVELLTPDLTRPEPYINKFWAPVICGGLAFLGVCFGNYATPRPVFSGLQRHLAATGIGGYIGHVIDGYRNSHYAERDAVLRHYIQLHPDDFPIPERKKFSEVFEPWVPIR